jgi:hypothetical protein
MRKLTHQGVANRTKPDITQVYGNTPEWELDGSSLSACVRLPAHVAQTGRDRSWAVMGIIEPWFFSSRMLVSVSQRRPRNPSSATPCCRAEEGLGSDASLVAAELEI